MTDVSNRVGVVVIGRNEGERLKHCLMSLSAVARVIYVDSGSTDGSVEWATSKGVEVVKLDSRLPFTAARARNSGFYRLCELAPNIAFVQFIDGDCVLLQDWINHAEQFLIARTDVGAVSGLLRERHPERSIYNWICEQGWNGPSGETRFFGGIVMIRVDALKAVGGFRDEMIAGEEPELAIRLRAAGWRVWRLDYDMATHDVAIEHFHQWWRRTVRTGYGFAFGAHLHGAPPERHWVWESRRAWIWGLLLPLGCLIASLFFIPWGWATWLIFPMQVARQTLRNNGSLKERTVLALFQVVSRFPEAIGQLKFMSDHVLKHRSQLIEYK